MTMALMSLHICTVSSELSFSHNEPSHKIVTYCTSEWQWLWWACTYAQSHQSFPSHIMNHLTRLLLIALEWQRLWWVCTYAQSHKSFPSHILTQSKEIEEDSNQILSLDMWFPTMCHFGMCRVRWASASF